MAKLNPTRHLRLNLQSQSAEIISQHMNIDNIQNLPLPSNLIRFIQNIHRVIYSYKHSQTSNDNSLSLINYLQQNLNSHYRYSLHNAQNTSNTISSATGKLEIYKIQSTNIKNTLQTIKHRLLQFHEEKSHLFYLQHQCTEINNIWVTSIQNELGLQKTIAHTTKFILH